MFNHSKMAETNYILERALDVESLRRKVISNNIANVDVPHFKRSEVNFESQLNRVLTEKQRMDNKLPARLENDKHIPFFVPGDVRGVRPRINVDYNTTQRNDGNNVDIEKEMVDAAKNLMRYNAMISSIGHNYKMLKMAMKS